MGTPHRIQPHPSSHVQLGHGAAIAPRLTQRAVRARYTPPAHLRVRQSPQRLQPPTRHTLGLASDRLSLAPRGLQCERARGGGDIPGVHGQRDSDPL